MSATSATVRRLFSCVSGCLCLVLCVKTKRTRLSPPKMRLVCVSVSVAALSNFFTDFWRLPELLAQKTTGARCSQDFSVGISFPIVSQSSHSFGFGTSRTVAHPRTVQVKEAGKWSPNGFVNTHTLFIGIV